MNQRFTNVLISAANAIIWGVAVEVVLAVTGSTNILGWLPYAVMVVAFLGSLAALNWLTSESR